MCINIKSILDTDHENRKYIFSRTHHFDPDLHLQYLNLYHGLPYSTFEFPNPVNLSGLSLYCIAQTLCVYKADTQ